MGLVSIRIDGRSYTLSCNDGKEDYIEECATYLDKRAKELKAGIGHVPENMLLCLLCLTLVDEMKQASTPSSSSGGEAAVDYTDLIEVLNTFSEKLEKA